MIERLVQTEIGPLEVIVHSPTSGIVRSPHINRTDNTGEVPLPTVVNGVQVTFRVDIGPNTNPHLPPLGAPAVNHTNIRKVDAPYTWEPSWAMRSKVDKIALEAFTGLLADPAFTRQAEITKVESDLVMARLRLGKARKELDAAEAEVRRLDKQLDALALLQISEA